MAGGKVVVITGATSGIGRAAAIGMAAAGFQVAICGRRTDRLEETRTQAGAAFAATCDVTDHEDVARFFADARDALGRIDVVFNNAGQTAPRAAFGDIEIADWRRIVSVNLDGAFYVAREAFRHMRAQDPQGGRIINNGSISAYVPRPQAGPYNATKHAITGLTKSIALDGRPFNIACGQIDIGNTATDMTARMSTGSLQADLSTKPEPTFDVRHVVDALIYMANLPPEANVQFMTVMATAMPYIGRG